MSNKESSDSIPGMTQDTFNVGIVASLPFTETVFRLQEALQAEEMLLIHEINVQKIVAAHHLEIAETKQLLFFHPRYMQRILKLDTRAILEAPLKFAVISLSPETTMVRYLKPTSLFGRYPDLESLGQELEELVSRIISTIDSESDEKYH